MECPICGSKEVDVPTVDVGVGSVQCGPAMCMTCNAAQDYDGKWIPYNPNEKSPT